MLLSTEVALRVSIDCYDAAWSGHLELEISIVRHCIESSECGSSEQCVIATAEGDDIEDQFFASEVVRGSEDHFECKRACTAGFYTWYDAFKGRLCGFNP